MSNFNVANAIYDKNLRELKITDPGHADTFNPLFKQLINNDEQTQ